MSAKKPFYQIKEDFRYPELNQQIKVDQEQQKKAEMEFEKEKEQAKQFYGDTPFHDDSEQGLD